MEFFEDFKEIVRETMPTGAKVFPVRTSTDLFVTVRWRLLDASGQPEQMSKDILICVSNEAAHVLEKAPTKRRRLAYDNIRLFLSQRLALFSPRRDMTADRGLPAEKWVINSAVLFTS